MKSFQDQLKSSSIISGKFDFDSNAEDLMDLDIIDKQFISCEINGGDFASSSFIGCTFDKVVIENSNMVGVSFDNCNFVDCRFLNVELSFGMKNCKINKLNVTRLKL